MDYLNNLENERKLLREYVQKNVEILQPKFVEPVKEVKELLFEGEPYVTFSQSFVQNHQRNVHLAHHLYKITREMYI